MTRASITYEEVASIIEDMMLKHEKPTILKIKEFLGGHGSTKLISKYLKDWKEKAIQENNKMLEKNHKIPKTINIEIDNDEKDLNKELEVTVSVNNEKENNNNIVSKILNNQSDEFKVDPSVRNLISNSRTLSDELLNTMSDEWNIILTEDDAELKVRKLHSCLIKEQIRREIAEREAKEAKIYSIELKKQVAQRINDLKEYFETQILFFKNEIKVIKKSSGEDLDFYREKLEKAINKIKSSS